MAHSTRVLRIHKLLLVVAVAASIAAVAPTIATSAPTKVTVVLTGFTPQDDTFVHYGTFTASPPLCPTGTWTMDGVLHRTFTCDDGSGSFPARFSGEPWERTGGTASWQIATAGTGRYISLRGAGTADVVVIQTGDPIKFQATWQGTVDFDATPPTLKAFSGRATATQGSRTRKVVHLQFTVRDLPSPNPVGYQLLVFAGARQLGPMHTGTASGTVDLSFRVSVPPGTHSLRCNLALADPVGNTSVFDRRLRIR